MLVTTSLQTPEKSIRYFSRQHSDNTVGRDGAQTQIYTMGEKHIKTNNLSHW